MSFIAVTHHYFMKSTHMQKIRDATKKLNMVGMVDTNYDMLVST